MRINLLTPYMAYNNTSPQKVSFKQFSYDENEIRKIQMSPENLKKLRGAFPLIKEELKDADNVPATISESDGRPILTVYNTCPIEFYRYLDTSCLSKKVDITEKIKKNPDSKALARDLSYTAKDIVYSKKFVDKDYERHRATLDDDDYDADDDSFGGSGWDLNDAYIP